MSGCIVQVWFEANSEYQERNAYFQIIETELDDFATFCEMVDADLLIGGAILWTTRDRDGTRQITRRQPCAFRGSAVLRCQLPIWRFAEADSPLEEP